MQFAKSINIELDNIEELRFIEKLFRSKNGKDTKKLPVVLNCAKNIDIPQKCNELNPYNVRRDNANHLNVTKNRIKVKSRLKLSKNFGIQPTTDTIMELRDQFGENVGYINFSLLPTPKVKSNKRINKFN